MYNQMYKCQTANEAWEHIFADLRDQAAAGNEETSRDGAVVGELINPVIVIEDPTRGIITSKQRGMPMRYAVGELMWYLSGSNKTRDIAQYSLKWDDISDDGEHSNSAYGYRIHTKFGFDQWMHVKNLLTSDPNSRQALIHIKEPSCQYTKDLPCTICLQFLIRDSRLHMTVYMRSNDIWMGFPYDVFSFTAFQIKMAFELGCEIGTYTHMAGSLHLYGRDYETFKKKHTAQECIEKAFAKKPYAKDSDGDDPIGET